MQKSFVSQFSYKKHSSQLLPSIWNYSTILIYIIFTDVQLSQLLWSYLLPDTNRENSCQISCHQIFMFFFLYTEHRNFTFRTHMPTHKYKMLAPHLETGLHLKMKCSSHFLSVFTSVFTYRHQSAYVICHTVRLECHFLSGGICVNSLCAAEYWIQIKAFHFVLYVRK